MTDLLQVLPDLDTTAYTHLLPSLEKALITTGDLITLDAFDIAKRAQLPPKGIKKLADEILQALHNQTDCGSDEEPPPEDDTTEVEAEESLAKISTLDDSLDEALSGGFPAGYVTEITGESAAGKTQLLLSLLLAVQLPPPHGLDKSALYISTEAPLSTKRLSQILSSHPRLNALPLSDRPSLSRIQSTQLQDLESQEHILRYQVPIQIQRSNIGLVVIDSIAANFRAEFESSKTKKSVEALALRSLQLAKLGDLLRQIASSNNVAVVVANQVLDRFAPVAVLPDQFSILSQRSTQLEDHGVLSQRSAPLGWERSLPKPLSAPAPAPTDVSSQFQGDTPLNIDGLLSLDHQQRFCSGWGDDPSVFRDLKTPSLGFTWTLQVAARIVLLKEPILKPQDYVLGPGMDIVGWKRWIKVAYAKDCADSNGMEGIPFEIWEGGIRYKSKDYQEKVENGSA